MPLYFFDCGKCNSVFETIVAYCDREEMARCPSCGGDGRRQRVSRFCVSNCTSKVDVSALNANGSDFVSDPDKFVTAMDTFGEKIGDRLTPRQKERAVENLKQEKK